MTEIKRKDLTIIVGAALSTYQEYALQYIQGQISKEIFEAITDTVITEVVNQIERTYYAQESRTETCQASN